MASHLFFAFLLALLFFVTPDALAQNECGSGHEIKLTQTKAEFESNCFSTYFDPSGQIRPDTLLHTHSSLFKSAPRAAINHGFQVGTLWIRTRIHNDLQTAQELFLSLGNPLIDRARLYDRLPHGAIQLLGESGVLVQGSQKQVRDRDITFKIRLERNETKDILIESFAHQQSYKLTFRSAEQFRAHQLTENLLFGLYFGIIIVMMLYNAFLYIVVRDKMYLWYVGTILFFHGFCFSGLLGASNYFLWPEFPNWGQRQLPVSAPLGLLFTFLFANEFLQIAHRSQKMRSVVKGFLLFVALQTIASAIWFSVPVVIVGFFAQMTALAITLYVALPLAIVGDRPARLFLLAWGFLIAGGLSFSLGQFGLFSHNFFTQNGILFGSSAEVILLSIALGDKINQIRLEKEHAQEREIQGAKLRALMEAEISAAHAVQETLLPHGEEKHELEFSTCYYVAERMGGDWFWHSSDPANQMMYFYVGDVTGHGIPSALLTGVVCGAATALDYEYATMNKKYSPEDRLLHTAQVMNEAVARTGARSDRWMSLCLIGVNVSTGELYTINAGHPFPIIWRTTENKIEPVVCSGPLLGHPTAQFSLRRDQLVAGDQVLLFTDGYLEAIESKQNSHRSRKRELAQMFINCESPEQVITFIKTQVEQKLSQHSVLSDDVTALSFRWVPRPANILPLRRLNTGT